MKVEQGLSDQGFTAKLSVSSSRSFAMASSLEKRVAAIEQEIAQLKVKLAGSSEKPWWEQISGTFANDPAYKEASRLGREYRESLRPKPGKGAKRGNRRPRH